MSRDSWAQSGTSRRTFTGIAHARAPRPEGSWSAAVARASEWWDSLTGGRRSADGHYSDPAAAAILSTALGLWADTAASMAEGDQGD